MAISKKVRFEVFKRDLFTCQYCGKRPPDVVLEADHVHPRCDGGSDEMDNLTTSCWDCNRGKAGNQLGKTSPAVDELARLAAMQEMGERSRLLLTQKERAKEEQAILDTAAGDVLEWWCSEVGDTEEWWDVFQYRSLRTFLKRGLPMEELRDAVDATATKMDRKNLQPWQAWRYFCGVCWAKIGRMEGKE